MLALILAALITLLCALLLLSRPNKYERQPRHPHDHPYYDRK